MLDKNSFVCIIGSKPTTQHMKNLIIAPTLMMMSMCLSAQEVKPDTAEYKWSPYLMEQIAAGNRVNPTLEEIYGRPVSAPIILAVSEDTTRMKEYYQHSPKTRRMVVKYSSGVYPVVFRDNSGNILLTLIEGDGKVELDVPFKILAGGGRQYWIEVSSEIGTSYIFFKVGS